MDPRDFLPRTKRFARRNLWDFLIARGVMRLKDGNLMRCAEWRPADLDGATTQEFLDVHRRVAQALAFFERRYVHHIEVRNEEAPAPEPSPMPALGPRLVEESRCCSLAGTLFRRRHFLSTTWRVPAARAAWLDAKLLGAEDEAEEQGAMAATVEPFVRLCDIAWGAIRDQGAWLKALEDPGELYTYLNNCVYRDGQAIAAPPYPCWPVDQIFFGAGPPFRGWPLLRFEIGDEQYRYLLPIGIDGLPGCAYPGLLDEFASHQFAWSMTHRLDMMDRSETVTHWRKKYRDVKGGGAGFEDIEGGLLSKRKGDPSDPGVLAELALAAQQLGDTAAGPREVSAFYTPVVLVWDENKTALLDKRDALLGTLRAGRFKAREEKRNREMAFLSTWPGQIYAGKRTRAVPTLVAADCMTLHEPSPGARRSGRYGGQPPLAVVVTAGRQAFGLDTFHAQSGHALLLGPQRSGKSSAAAYMTYAFQRYPGAQVFVVEVDGDKSAFRTAAYGAGGEVVPFTTERGAVEMQPLADCDTAWGLASARRMVMRIFRLAGVERVLTLERIDTDLDRALGLLGRPGTERSDRNFTHLKLALAEPELRGAVARYCGSSIDGRTERVSEAPFVVFDLTALLDGGPEVEPYMAAVVDFIYRRTRAAVRPTLVVLDEFQTVKRLLGEDGVSDLLARLPKHNASLWVCAHSFAHFDTPLLADLARLSFRTKLLFPDVTLADLSDERLAGLGLRRRDAEIVHQLAEQGVLGQFYVARDDERRAVSLELDAVGRLFCAQGGQEGADLRNRVLARWGRERFAEGLLHEAGLGPEPAMMPIMEAAE